MDSINVEAIKSKYEIKSGDPNKVARRYKWLRYSLFTLLIGWALISFIQDEDNDKRIAIMLFGLYIIASFVLYLALYWVRMHELKKDQPFVDEFNQIVAEYRRIDDGERYLEALLSMRSVARDAAVITQWRMSAALALTAVGKYDEALDLIDDLDGYVTGKAKEQLSSTRARIHALSSTAAHSGDGA